jgi:hypothetical protein
MALQRPIFSSMASAKIAQTKGLGGALWVAMYSSMAAINSGARPKVSRRMRLVVISRNHRSTRFSYDELIGVKCEVG